MVKESNREANGKKKRKSTSSNDNSDVDLYKTVIDFEEKEAHTRSGELDAQLYFATCAEIRNLLMEIGELKLRNNLEAKSKIQELTSEICLKIVLLKNLNRMEKVRQVLPKEMLIQEKQKVDSINLQYQNLLYEANHLHFEYRKCFQFKSKDECIELVSVDEFLKEAPKELTEKFIQCTEDDEEIKHDLRLARLNWELQQRKHLAEMCRTLEKEKESMLEDIEERRNRLSKLGPLLANVMEATKPVQEHLNLHIDERLAEHKLASFLPNPMYIFYANADAFKQVNDKTMDVVIVGDEDEAIRYKDLQEKNLYTFEDDEEDDDEMEHELEIQEAEEVVEVKKRRHRKSIQIDPLEVKKQKLLETHPLEIEVTIRHINELSIKFKLIYFTKLQIVTVKSEVNIPNTIIGNSAQEVLSGDSILMELVDDDLGLDSPNPCTSYQLKKVGITSFASLISNLGRPYNWAQKVCGLDFVSKLVFTNKNSDQITQSCVELIMKTIKKRLHCRLILAKQLEQLENNIIPSNPNNEILRQTVSNLIKWSSITYQSFSQNDFCEKLIESDLISQNDLFYLAKISRFDAILDVFIAIKNDYPQRAPIFAMTLNYNGNVRHSLNDDNIRDIERAVNVDWNRDFNNIYYLLSAQITSVCIYLDIYLETENPKAFPQNTIYIKSTCARNRRKPFKYRNIGVGVFTQ